MLDIFGGKAEIALSTNKLFETGFYLLNLGFALLIMHIAEEVSDSRTMLEILSNKIGSFSIYLGIMLFFNLYLFFRGRRISKERARLAEALKKIPGNSETK
jgi:F0F1-type ATP synthase assembly protein I